MNTTISDAVRKEHRWRVVFITALVVLAMGMTGLFAFRVGDRQSAEARDSRIAQLEAQRKRTERDRRESQQKVEALADQLVELGERPVVDPDEDTPPPEVSQDQANAAFVAYCAAYPNRCKGPQGEGLTASDALVAIRQYCSREDCEVSQSEILDAVARGCQTGRIQCRGEQGGVGKKGEEGLGITAVSCTEDGFVFEMTNGTTRGPVGVCLAQDGQDGADGARGPEGPAGKDATCEGAFVCEGELSDFLTEAQVRQLIAQLIAPLDCEVDTTGNNLIPCNVTGKPETGDE